MWDMVVYAESRSKPPGVGYTSSGGVCGEIDLHLFVVVLLSCPGSAAAVMANTAANSMT